MFKQILVGVDEYEGGRDAIALAKRLIAADGQITLAFVETGEPYVYGGVSGMYEAGEQDPHARPAAQGRRAGRD